MSEARKPFVAVALIAAGIAAVSAISWLHQGKEIIPWRASFQAAQVEAHQSNKPVFLYLTASWCGPCQSLRTTTWADKDVAAALSDYVPVRVDVDDNPEIRDKYLRTPANLDGGIPAFRILDDEGVIKRESVGALPPGQFLSWIKRR